MTFLLFLPLPLKSMPTTNNQTHLRTPRKTILPAKLPEDRLEMECNRSKSDNYFHSIFYEINIFTTKNLYKKCGKLFCIPSNINVKEAIRRTWRTRSWRRCRRRQRRRRWRWWLRWRKNSMVSNWIGLFRPARTFPVGKLHESALFPNCWW